jgi:hypothetical protein
MRRSKKALSILVLVVFLVSMLCITALAEETTSSDANAQETDTIIVTNNQDVSSQTGDKVNTATTSSGGGRQVNQTEGSSDGTESTGTSTTGTSTTGTDDSDSQSNANGNEGDDTVTSVDVPVDSAVPVDHASTVAVGVQANRTVIINRTGRTSVQSTSSSSNIEDIPKTGDTMDSLLWIVIGGIGIALIAYVVLSNLKKKSGTATK